MEPYAIYTAQKFCSL